MDTNQPFAAPRVVLWLRCQATAVSRTSCEPLTSERTAFEAPSALSPAGSRGRAGRHDFSAGLQHAGTVQGTIRRHVVAVFLELLEPIETDALRS